MKLRFFLSVFLVCIIEFVIITLLFKIDFETTDDSVMNILSSGSYTGSPETKLIFTNIWIGHILKLLYINFTTINWYSWYLIITLFVSYVAIQFQTMKFCENIFDKLTSHIIVFSVILIPALTSIQFTKIATISILSGALLILFNKNKVTIILGSFLIILGSGIRIQSLYLVLITILPILFILIYWGKSNFRTFLPLLIPIFLSFLFSFLNNKVYSSNHDWKQYKELNYLMSKLNDYDNPRFTYYNVKHALDKSEWTREDYNIISCFYLDYGVKQFENNTLKEIRNNTNQLYNLKSFDFLKSSFVTITKDVFVSLFSYNIILISILFFSLLFIIVRGSFSHLLFFIISVIYVFVVVWSLSIFTEGNFLKPRVTYSFFLPSIILFLILKEKFIERENNKISLFFLIGVLFILTISLINLPLKEKTKNASELVVEYLEKNEKNLFVFWGEIDGINVFKKPSSMRNAYFIAWLSGTPYNQKKLRQLNNQNYKGLYDIREKEISWYFVNYEKSLMSYTNGEKRKEKVVDFYKSKFSKCYFDEKKIPLNNKDTICKLSFFVPQY